MKSLVVVSLLTLFVVHPVAAQVGSDCSSLKWMRGSETVLRDITVADLLKQLAPKSKLFYSEDGLLVLGQDNYWFYLNREQNIVVMILNQSVQWKEFQSSIFPDSSLVQPLTSPFRKDRNPLLSDYEKCALLNLIHKLKLIFCYQTIDEVERMLMGFGTQIIDYQTLKRKSQLAEEEKQKRLLLEKSTHGLSRYSKLICYNDQLMFIDSQNQVRSFLKWMVDDNTLEKTKRLLGETGHIVFDSEIPASCCLSVTFGGRPVGEEVLPPPGFFVPSEELIRRKISSSLSSNEIKSTTDLRGDFALEEAKHREYRKQFCPFNLTELVDRQNRTVSVYLVDRGVAVTQAPNPLDNWVVVAGQECYKCGGIDQSAATYIIASQLETPIKVRNDIYRRINPESMDSLSRKSIEATEVAVDWRMANKHDTTEIRAIGEGGISFLDRGGNLVLLSKNQRIEFRNSNTFATEEFDSWYRIMSNGSPLDLRDPMKIMELIFDFSALGRGEWRKYFRQDPMAFAKKYCMVQKVN